MGISTLNVESSVPCSINFDYSPPLLVDSEDDKPIFNFAVGNDQSHGSFLASIVGAEIVVTTNDVTEDALPIEGFVLSVNQISNQIGTTEKLQNEYESCQILTNSGNIVSLNISTIKSIKLVDQTLQAELMKSLRYRITSKLKKSKKKMEGVKTISVQASDIDGNATAAVKISHLDQAEEWKAMYRLEMPDEDDLKL